MAFSSIRNSRIAGIGTCVPSKIFDNVRDTIGFKADEVKKVVAMAGISTRRVADDSICSSDLCTAASKAVLASLNWDPGSIDALIMVTQTPDYFLPSTACIIHKHLNLSETCATFDLGMGCSGYAYGLWLASMMLAQGGLKRVLVLHGDTPARYSLNGDRSVSLLFGDAGSATALEVDLTQNSRDWHYLFHTDSSGLEDMIIEGGAFRNRFPDDPVKYYLRMNGANVFNFTLKRVPSLIADTLEKAKTAKDDIDYYIFHQSNQFIMKHLVNKIGLKPEKVPIILGQFGNTGGCSVPLAMTQGNLERPGDRALKLMLVGYGVGLSWASALVYLEPEAVLTHVELNNKRA